MTDVVMAAEGVSIGYDLRLTRDRTLRRTVAEMVRRNFEKPKYWALRDVSFTLRAGDILGVVGRNGSGKSTLLLALAGILRADMGYIDTFGRVPTLLTLTTGFEGDLTGRRNTYLQGAYFGLGRRRIDELLEQIIEFSELGQFFDIPVRKYSTGMRVRLAFSIAAFVEPEILLIDEVLGVGDVGFLDKSRDKIRELIGESHSIVIVSHDMSSLRTMCTKAMWLHEGRVAAYGEPAHVIDLYTSEMRAVTEPVRALD
jgi:homopolymeric O-antigen transport system ATP-binding protein